MRAPGLRTPAPAAGTAGTDVPDETYIEYRNFSFWYGERQVVREVNLSLRRRRVTAIIGPSGCGKSTLLRAVNRMHDLYPDQRVSGEILLDGRNVLGRDVDVNRLRARVGMLFQKPTPFPMTVFENIAFGVRLHERLGPSALAERVEWALVRAALWDEVRDGLHQSGLALSGGQQQRLCIARAIAVRPEALLLDEPTAGLDPVSGARIEELVMDLKQEFTMVIVTHNMQQAARVADYTAYLSGGALVEYDETDVIFVKPRYRETEDYVTGRFG